ncbi:hypothetical protein BROC_01855 [Candidatus Brocadiaceae bacterium]|nr:hypothetical protein BROC_01855 [Candidatus Brocadiaceae bacterium]
MGNQTDALLKCLFSKNKQINLYTHNYHEAVSFNAKAHLPQAQFPAVRRSALLYVQFYGLKGIFLPSEQTFV